MDTLLSLPATSWAVLGELSFERELSGYDLKQWADQSLAFFYWAPSQSQIYSELKRLESHELVTSRTEQTHELRSRRLYVITDLGRKQMKLWLHTAHIDPIVLKHPLMLKVWAAHNGDTTELIQRITDFQDSLREKAQRASAHARNASQVPEWKYSVLALEWSEKYYLDEVARLDWLKQRLAEMR